MKEETIKKIKKKKGFTLIELIIVVAIIAILAALAIPKLMGTQDNAKKKADIANGKMIHDTVAKLMTEGSLDTTGAVSDFDVATTSTAGDQKTLWDELQSKPVPKYKSHTVFHVNIGTDHTITVTTDGNGNEVYPEQKGDYVP